MHDLKSCRFSKCLFWLKHVHGGFSMLPVGCVTDNASFMAQKPYHTSITPCCR